MRATLCLLALLASACAPAAQAPAAPSASAPGTPADAPAVLAVAPANDAERAVQEMVAADGVHVVHFWAPWCDNSINELRQGWYEIVEGHPEVEFAFVTVWSDGAAGRETLERYAIPDRVRVHTQDDGRAEDHRRREFLGLPVTWLPTTWVFHQNGRLAFAFNYGELTMPQLHAAIESAAREW